MAISLKKTFLLVIMALVLLIGLFAWTMRMEAASPHNSGIRSSHTVAWYCPPPPRYC